MKQIITNSMRSTFLDCPYKCFCEYVRRLTPKREADYFKWGSYVHAGAHCQDIGKDLDEWIDEERQRIETATNMSPNEIVTCDEMLTLLPDTMNAHLLCWHKDDENYEMLGGEEYGGKFSLELPSGWFFQGKIDKVIRDIRSGKILTQERKTAKNANDTYFEDILLDSQPKGYLLATQRCFGFPAKDVLYDLYGKPGIRQKMGQTRVQYIKELGEKYLLDRQKLMLRRRMPFEQIEIDAYFWDINDVSLMIQWCLEEGIWPKHHPRNRIGGCAYKPICLHGDESKFYVRDYKAFNPELVDL